MTRELKKDIERVKVLLIVYNFPPFIRASSMRTHTWFSEFSNEVDVTVITRKWKENRIYNRDNYFEEDEGGEEKRIIQENKRIYYVPNKFNFYFKLKNTSFLKKLKINKAFTLVEQFLKWSSFSFLESERSLYNKAKNIMKSQKFDFILTSGEPFLLFKYCYRLNKKFNVPYVVDYRDSWTQNVSNTNSIIGKIISKIQKGPERKYIENARYISFISNQLRSEVDCFSLYTEKSIIISNGIDLKEYDGLVANNKIKNDFNLTFIGTLYEAHRIELLLDGLVLFIKKYPDCNLKLNFVGSLINCPPNIQRQIDDFYHKEIIHSINYLNHKESLLFQLNSDILLKFNAFEQKENHFGKKLYEYAASGKKVISINSKESFNNFLNFFDEKPFQYYCNTSADVFENLSSFWESICKGEELNNGITFSELKPYSTFFQTQKLEKILKK